MQEKHARAKLLAVLGLSPWSDMNLKAQTPLKPPAGALEDWVLEAFLSRTEMQVADRMTAIRREQVKIAIAEFLPKITGMASFLSTTDSYVYNPNYWTLGINGVISLFNGFSNVNQYRAARLRQEEAFVEREQESLAIMLEVRLARDALARLDEELTIAEASLRTAQDQLRQAEAEWNNGLLNASERLGTLARRDLAQAALTGATYQRQAAIAALLNVMGRRWSAPQRKPKALEAGETPTLLRSAILSP